MSDILLHRGARWDLVAREEPSRGNPDHRRELVIHPGSVVILPLLDDDRVVLIRNERVSAGRALIELPAGTRNPSELPYDCALRELTEETGYRCEALTPLTRFFIAPGVTDEEMHVFVAKGLSPGPQRLEDDERITVLLASWSECLAMIQRGQIEDAKSVAALLHYVTFVRSR
ncbi:MAG: NUDIX hydrolase [Deltaproteobacteria bacterium]|nr:NUDIX hydrolase [Deltaproteobacteria bacterium]